MRNHTLFLLALSSQAIAGDWKIHKRELTITSTVYSTTYFCPCSTFLPLPSSSASSTGVNPESIGSPLLTSAPVTSTSSITVPSISTVPSSFTSTPSVASSSTSSAPGSGGTVFVSAASLGDYQTSVLASHNVHRVNHTAPNLVWSPTMAQYAAQIASTCVYAHSKYAI
jgi:uncharacterized protein YkwD